MNDRAGEDRIAGYIRRYTEPVQWIHWWIEAVEPAASESLRSILYESCGEVLRDLTQPAIREAIVRAVLESEPLRRAVGAEADRFLETVAEWSEKGGQLLEKS